MKKGLLLTVFFTLLFTGSILAAPLDDYSKAGNVGLSIFTQRTDMSVSRKSNSPTYSRTFDYDAKWNWGGELTVSVAKNWALSFDYLDSKNKEMPLSSATSPADYRSSKLKSHNIKLKYQAYKDDKLFVAPYLGLAMNKHSVALMVPHSFNTERKTSVLAGVTLVYGLDKDNRFKTYFDGAIGNKVYSWNIGVAYGVSKNLDFDFGYRYYRSKGMRYDYPTSSVFVPPTGMIALAGDNGKIDSKSKGFYFGLSYKFN